MQCLRGRIISVPSLGLFLPAAFTETPNDLDSSPSCSSQGGVYSYRGVYSYAWPFSAVPIGDYVERVKAESIVSVLSWGLLISLTVQVRQGGRAAMPVFTGVWGGVRGRGTFDLLGCLDCRLQCWDRHRASRTQVPDELRLLCSIYSGLQGRFTALFVVSIWDQLVGFNYTVGVGTKYQKVWENSF